MPIALMPSAPCAQPGNLWKTEMAGPLCGTCWQRVDMKKLALLCVLCILLLPSAAWSRDIPALDLPGLAELIQKNRGKVILLNFFATWCPPCRVEIPHLVKVQRQFGDRDVLVVSLSVDEKAAAVPPFVRAMGMEYPVYLADRSVAAAYRVSTIPHNVMYDREGKLVASQSGILEEESLVGVIRQLLGK